MGVESPGPELDGGQIGSVSLANEPENPPKSLVSQLQDARSAGKSLHDMPAAITQPLAERHGIYTVEQPHHLGGFRRFLQEKKRLKSLGQIAAATTEAFAKVPGFEEAVASGTLGQKLVDAFAPVTHLHGEGVHVETITAERPRWMQVLGLTRLHPPKRYETVIADSMEYTVRTEEEASLVTHALQVILHKTNPKYSNLVDVKSRDGHHVVRASRFSEHDARSVSRTVGALLIKEAADQEIADKEESVGRDIAEADPAPPRIIRPTQKLSLYELERRGVTVSPLTRAVLVAEDIAYQRLRSEMTLTARYPDNNGPLRALKPIERPDWHVIVTDPTPPLQGMRDLINTIIWQTSRGRNTNPEQNPDKAARPSNEQNVELRRDPKPAKETYGGPPQSRPPTWFEMAKDGIMETVQERPLWFLASLGSIPLAVNLPTFFTALPALPYVHGAAKGAYHLQVSHREWQLQKKAAAAVDRRLDTLTYTLAFQKMRSQQAVQPQVTADQG